MRGSFFTGRGRRAEDQHDRLVDYGECSEIARMLASRFKDELSSLTEAIEGSQIQ